jgi:hypothetical protein
MRPTGFRVCCTAVLAAMGQKPTEEELFQMISEVDDNMSGAIGTWLCSPMVVVGTLLCVSAAATAPRACRKPRRVKGGVVHASLVLLAPLPWRMFASGGAGLAGLSPQTLGSS